MSEFFRTVNWKTSGYAIAYFACWIFGALVPAAESLCEMLDKLIIVAGFVSTADAERVKSVVRAVDAIAWRVKMDPASLIPTSPEDDLTLSPVPAVVATTK